MALAFSESFGSNGDVDEDIVRHVSLDGIRLINSKFRSQYGDPILAIDSRKGSWRKKVFPYYKAHRSDDRKKSSINWPELIRQMDVIKNEIKETFPYLVIEIDKAEADDTIGVLSRLAVENKQDAMIISGDRDFIQLQVDNQYVQQWDKRSERFVGADDPKRYLFEHVMKGDRGDGIPNILSPGDSFVNKIRQKPMTQKRLNEFWEDSTLLRPYADRVKENINIIDLKYTPSEIKEAVMEHYNVGPPDHPRSRVRDYMIEHRLKKLHENIQDF